MNKPPSFQFNATEYLSDGSIQLMSLEEEGVYIRLLAHCWCDASIPADDESLSRLCKGAPASVIRSVKTRFVHSGSGASRLVHPQLAAERARQDEWRRKSSAGGKKAQKRRRRGAAV
jgi:uncharacterized protein YdaU (DUF1376 family)